METLELRLKKLERSLKRAKFFVAVLLVVLVALASLGSSDPQPIERIGESVITTRGLNIVNEQGQIVMMLDSSSEGGGSLNLFGKGGDVVARIFTVATKKGDAGSIELSSGPKIEDTSVLISTTKAGAGLIFVNGGEGDSYVSIGREIELINANGTTVASLENGKFGGILNLRNKDDKPLLLVRENEEGQSLALGSPQGAKGARLFQHKGGAAGLCLAAEDKDYDMVLSAGLKPETSATATTITMAAGHEQLMLHLSKEKGGHLISLDDTHIKQTWPPAGN